MTLLGMFAKAIITYQDNESFDIIEIQHSDKEYEYITVNSADIITQKSYIQQKYMNYCYTCYHFMQSRVGNAVLIYAVSTYNNLYDTYRYAAPEMIAIKSTSDENNIVYIIKEFFFNIYYRYDKANVSLPYGIEKYEDYKKSLETYVNDEIIPEYYKLIEPEKLTEAEIKIFSIAVKARKSILDRKQEIPVCPTRKIELGFSDVDNILCGFTDIYNIADKKFNNNKAEFASDRAIQNAIKNMIDNNKVKVFDWEKEIADALNLFLSDSHKINVNVEFKINKITSTGKMNARNLKDILIRNASIDEYDFSTNSEGAAVMIRLGSVSHLTCANISKISYGRKTLYERKDEITK